MDAPGMLKFLEVKGQVGMGQLAVGNENKTMGTDN